MEKRRAELFAPTNQRSLDLMSEPKVSNALSAPESSVSAKKRQCVLIADDDRDAREALGDLLELLGHNVTYASDGTEAVKVAKARTPDIIFLDIQMPGLDGYEVCHELRSTAGLEKARIFALSGQSGADHDRRCTAERFDAQLLKPFDPVRLVRLL